MKFVVYTVLFFTAALMFLPEVSFVGSVENQFGKLQYKKVDFVNYETPEKSGVSS